MKSVIKLFLIGGILFGLSYAGSSFLLVNKKVPEVAETDPTQPQIPEADSPVKENGFTVEANRLADTAPGPAVEKVDSMPVSLQTDQPLSIESVLQLAESIRKKEEQLDQREKIVLRDEQRVKLMFDDVAQEQKELSAMGDRVDSKVMAARELLVKIQQERAELGTEKKSADKSSGASGKGSPATDEIDGRVAAIGDIFSGFPDDQAANYIRDHANSGGIEFAAALLGNLDEKRVPKIIAALNDDRLGHQLMEAIVSRKVSKQASR